MVNCSTTEKDSCNTTDGCILNGENCVCNKEAGYKNPNSNNESCEACNNG